MTAVLAFDTATPATAVALCVDALEARDDLPRVFEARDDPPRVFEARDDPPPGRRPGHAQRLLPLAREVLDQAGIGWDGVERIAVGTGPGTFTGLRIGIATARGLARGLGIPVTGVSTLHSVALNAVGAGAHEGVLAVLDARRREVFVAGWRGDPAQTDSERLLEPRAMAPEALAEQIAAWRIPLLALGNGAVEFRAVLERSGALIPEDLSPLHRVSAVNHCLWLCVLPASAPDDVQPEYLRLPDAEIARRTARQS